MKKVIIALFAVASVATADIYITATAGFGIYNASGTAGLLGNSQDALIQLIYTGSDGVLQADDAGIGGALTSSDAEELIIGTGSFTSSASAEADFSAYLTGYTANFQSAAQAGGSVVVRVFADSSAAAGSSYYQSAVYTAADATVGTPPGPPTETFDFAGVDGLTANGTVIPEPATIGLLGIAGAGLYAARRKTLA